jgi:hypothetical protein
MFTKKNLGIIAFLVIIVLCLGIANAESYSTVNQYNQVVQYTISSDVAQYLGGNAHVPPYWAINFNLLTNPSVILYYYNCSGVGVTQQGTFTFNYGGDVIINGTYGILYGNIAYGSKGYSNELYLYPTSYNSHGHTGTILATSTFSPAINSANIPMYGDNTGKLSTTTNPFISYTDQYQAFTNGGTYATNDMLSSSVNISMNNNFNPNFITINFSKMGNYSLNAIYNGNTNALLWQESGSSNGADALATVNYQPIVIQSTFFSTHTVNSLIYFSATGNLPPAYSVAVSPTNPIVNQTITPTINNNGILLSGAGLNALQYILLQDTSTDDPNLYVNLPSGSIGYDIVKQSNGTWQYNSGGNFVGNLGTTLVLPSFALSQKGLHNISVEIVDNNGVAYYGYVPITVQGTPDYINLKIRPYDQITGAAIEYATYNIYNPLPVGWRNTTLTHKTYLITPVSFGQNYGIQISADNYQTSIYKNLGINFQNGFLASQIGTTADYMIPMYPSSNTIGAGNTTITAVVLNSQTKNGIVNAPVTVTSTTNNISYTQTIYTGLSSAATFIVPQNNNYQITTSFPSFTTGTSIVTVVTQPININLMLDPIVTPTITSVITVPTTITPIPTIASQGIGNITNGTSGANGNGVCLINAQGLSPLDQLKNFAACNGVKTESNQNLLLGLMLVGLFGIIGGKVGKGLGFIAGVAAGYVGALVLGLMPLWTFFAFLIIAGLIIGSKIVLSKE